MCKRKTGCTILKSLFTNITNNIKYQYINITSPCKNNNITQYNSAEQNHYISIRNKSKVNNPMVLDIDR